MSDSQQQTDDPAPVSTDGSSRTHSAPGSGDGTSRTDSAPGSGDGSSRTDSAPALIPDQAEIAQTPPPAADPAGLGAEDGKPELADSEPAKPDTPFAELGKILAIIPTYNEAGNVEGIVSRVRNAVPEIYVLIADDNSPDGTGKLADSIAAKDDHVHVLHRLGKEGLGAAYLAGFTWALDNGYDVMIEMDADGSHQPEQLPLLLDALRDADLVLGSRWVPGGTVINWPKSREILSRGGNWYTRHALGLPLRDATGGFRAFRASTLRILDLDGVGSAGYIFQVDLAYRVVQAGLTVKEVPIEFKEREVGVSKMSGNIVTEALWMVTVWGARERMRKAGRRRIRNSKAKRDQGW